MLLLSSVELVLNFDERNLKKSLRANLYNLLLELRMSELGPDWSLNRSEMLDVLSSLDESCKTRIYTNSYTYLRWIEIICAMLSTNVYSNKYFY